MVVINFQDELQPGPLERAIHHLIEQRLDFSVVFPSYQKDAAGRYTYNPAILFKIVLFAYYKGIRSSQEIQWNYQNNITFMAPAFSKVPRLITIAQLLMAIQYKLNKWRQYLNKC
jgi:transposase